MIFGGRSGEHEVSLRSARSVMDAIDKDKYDVVPIGITRAGRWIAGGDPYAALTAGDEVGMVSAALIGAPGDNAIKSIEPASEGGHALHDVASVDVIFPVLHGTFGEDGTIQGLFELADVPYVGAGVVGSAVGMDKVIFKAVMEANGIPILPYQLVLRSRWEADPEAVLDALEAALTYPMFAKPANLGSSVGVVRAKDRVSLAKAVAEAALYDRRVVVEQGADVREIEVSVLGNEDPVASVPGEVIPGDEFYSYEDKYINDTANLIIPAELSPDQTVEIQRIAVDAFKLIDCAGLGRCDFFVERGTGAIYMNEINTIPGFTSISMYPKLWEASGIPYTELIDRLIQLALDRYEDRSRNKTSFEPES